MTRASDLLDVRDRLEVAVRAAREAVAHDTTVNVQLSELIAVARKVTPASRAPPGILFSVDQGPAEALPIRFRLPYPTLDEMKMSFVATEGNKWTAATTTPDSAPVAQPIQPAQPKPMIEEEASDDYEGDF